MAENRFRTSLLATLSEVKVFAMGCGMKQRWTGLVQ
jgi:hypothetical protein